MPVKQQAGIWVFFLKETKMVIINVQRIWGSQQSFISVNTGSPSSLYEPHKEHNMAWNYKGLYGIFYKISMKVVKSENIQ